MAKLTENQIWKLQQKMDLAIVIDSFEEDYSHLELEGNFYKCPSCGNYNNTTCFLMSERKMSFMEAMEYLNGLFYVEDDDEEIVTIDV